jgi:hypothetical protein
MADVTVDAEVWTAWSDPDRDDLCLPLLFRSPLPVREAYAAVREAVLVAGDADGVAPTVTCTAPVPGGVGLMLEEGTEIGLLLDTLVELLTAAGVSGVFGLADNEPEYYPFYDGAPGGYLLGRAALRATPTMHRARWAVDADVVHSVVATAAAWVTERGPLRGTSLSLHWTADPAEAAELAALYLTTTDTGDVDLRARPDEPFRSARISPWYGQVTFVLGHPVTRAGLADLSSVLTAIAPLTTYAYIDRALRTDQANATWQQGIMQSGGSDPGLAIQPGTRRVEQTGPAEAFGVQLLTGSTQGIAPQRWIIEPVTGGALVTARDLGPWFDAPTVDDQVRAAARRDLGAALL